MKDEECVYYLDSSKCDSADCHGCVARLKENKRKYHDKEIRTKAISEFAEKLKESMEKKHRHLIDVDRDGFEWLTTDAVETHIDETAKELKGE